jgi:cupin
MCHKTVQIENDRDSSAISELFTLSVHAHDPVISVSTEALEEYLHEVGGAKGISVPDVLEPQQISASLYIGGTTPQALTEVPHWHPDQTEAYVILEGKAMILAKYRWQEDWVRREAQGGDLLIVQPEVCHWFSWLSVAGLALVFKAPQRAGIGRYPAGKTICKFCPHFKRGCVLPEGFTPQE